MEKKGFVLSFLALDFPAGEIVTRVQLREAEAWLQLPLACSEVLRCWGEKRESNAGVEN